MILLREDGTPLINSFAHHGIVYQLKFDAAAVLAAIKRTDNDAVVKIFIELATTADLDKAEEEALRDEVAKRSGVNKRTISGMLKAAREKHAGEKREQERKRREAERSDPRLMIRVPFADAPWLPQVLVLNGVVGSSSAAEPPARDIDGFTTRVRKLPVPGTHAFTDANPEEELP